MHKIVCKININHIFKVSSFFLAIFFIILSSQPNIAAAQIKPKQAPLTSTNLNPLVQKAAGIDIKGKISEEKGLFLKFGSSKEYEQLKQKGLITNTDQIEKEFKSLRAPIIKPKLDAKLNAVSPVEGTILITSCGVITTPGRYVLNNNLQQTIDGEPCVYVYNILGDSFSLDCRGKSISGKGTSAAFYMDTVQNFTLSNCTFNNTPLGPGEYAGPPVVSIYSSKGTMKYNTFNGGGLVTYAMNNTLFSNNNVNTIFFLDYANGTTITSNIFKKSWLYATGNGNSNVIINNVIDGGYPTSSAFSDDGIAFTDQTNLTISGNRISNVSDCGIEGVGLLSDSKITYNTVINAGYCGIGSWYWTSWKGNTISNNSITKSPYMFQLYLVSWFFFIDEPFYYFKDNIFANNTFGSTPQIKYDPTISSTNIDFQNIDPSLTAKLVLGKNTFTSNIFSLITSSQIIPSSIVKDGGNNKCIASPSQSSFPLSCGK